MYLLSRRKDNVNIGADERELLDGLGLSDKNAKSKLVNLLDEFGKNIAHLGLKVKYNTINDHWYLSFRDNVPYLTNQSETNVLSLKLSATLFAVLMVSLTQHGAVSIAEIKEIRNKKNVIDDLEELERKGYVKRNEHQIVLTGKIFYHIDLDDIMNEIKNFTEQNSESNISENGETKD
mgnify:CR=1 FL=1